MDRITFYKDSDGDWRWRRRSPNGDIVGASTEGYNNLDDACQNASINTGLVIKLEMTGRWRQDFSLANPPVVAVIDPVLLEQRNPDQ